MRKLLFNKITVLCIACIFMFSNIVVLAAPIEEHISLGKDYKAAKKLDFDKTYQVEAKEGEELWFKVDAESLREDKTHISVLTEGKFANLSMFHNEEKAKNKLALSDYFMKEQAISFPLAWDSKEYYVMILPQETGFIKLVVNNEKRAPSEFAPDITFDNLCPTEVLSQENKEILKLLPEFRNIRDNMFSASEAGRQITSVYYQLSKKIYASLVTNKDLRNSLIAEVKSLNGLLNQVAYINKSGRSDYIVTSSDIKSLNNIKNIVANVVDKDIKGKIEDLWKNLSLDKYINKSLSQLVNDKFFGKGETTTGTEIIISTSKKVSKAKIKNKINGELSKLKSSEVIKIEEKQGLFNKSEKDFIINIPSGKDIKSLKKELLKDSDIKLVEENYTFKTSSKDVNYSYQWGLENTGQKIPSYSIDGNQSDVEGKKAADINYRSLINSVDDKKLKNTVIAVIDSGINHELADFKGNVDISKGYNFVNDTKDVMDTFGHGTHVAGVINAKANNGYSMTGINQHATIIPIKVVNSFEMGKIYNIAQGIKHAVDNGAKVINMSLGWDEEQFNTVQPGGMTHVKQALKYAHDKNVAVIVSAGNDGQEKISFPASSEYAISVGSINNKDTLSVFSNYGKGITLVAPGEGVASLIHNGEVNYMSGTSMSAPHVSAVAGLLYSADPNMTNKKVKEILIKTARDLGSGGYDNKYGYGCIDANKALNEAIKGITE